MTDIAELGIRVDSTPATKAAKELDALTVSATRADNAAADLATTSRSRLSPGMAAAGGNSRMFAMQLSQVAQQASATGNFVQALAIQLPDMAMGFGAVGIAAGILASVTLPLLASAFGGTGDEAKRVADSVNAFAEAADAYIAAANAAGLSTDELAAKYGRLSTEARAALQAIADVAFVDAINAAQASIDAVANSLLSIQTFSNGRQVAVLAEDFGLAKSEAQGLASAIVALQNSDGLAAQARAAAEVQRQLMAAYGSAERMPAPLRAAYAEMAKITVKAAETNTTASRLPPILSGAAAAASNLASAVSSIGASASNATGAVQGLVNALVAAGNAQMALMKQSSLNFGKVQNTGGVDAIARAGNQAMGVNLAGTVASGAGGVFRGSGGGGGGGGGGADPYADNLRALVENLRSEREIEEEWYQESLTLLNDRRAAEILGKTQHDAAMVALHEEYNRRIAEIDANAGQQRITDTANLFGALASVAQAGGQKTAKAVATFQAIEGTINAYGAAIKALNTPGITLAGRFAAYASVLAAGLRGVAAIRQAGGVAGGGGGALAAQGATAQAAGPAVEYRVYGIDRDAMMSGAMWEKIWNGLFEEGKRRGVSAPQMVFI